MGVQVKLLLAHLRRRQEELGVKTFQFQHVLKGSEIVPAEYPPAARDTLSSEAVTQEPIKSDPVIPGLIKMDQDESKLKTPAKAKAKGQPKNPDAVKTLSKQRSPAKSKSPRKVKSSAKGKEKSDISSNNSPFKMEIIQDYCPPPACPSGDVFGGLSTTPFIPAATDAATPDAVAAAAPPILPLNPTIQNEPSSITGPGYVLPPPQSTHPKKLLVLLGRTHPSMTLSYSLVILRCSPNSIRP